MELTGTRAWITVNKRSISNPTQNEEREAECIGDTYIVSISNVLRLVLHTTLYIHGMSERVTAKLRLNHNLPK